MSHVSYHEKANLLLISNGRPLQSGSRLHFRGSLSFLLSIGILSLFIFLLFSFDFVLLGTLFLFFN